MTDLEKKWAAILSRAAELSGEVKPTWQNQGDTMGEAILLARFEHGDLKTLPRWLDFGVDGNGELC